MPEIDVLKKMAILTPIVIIAGFLLNSFIQDLYMVSVVVFVVLLFSFIYLDRKKFDRESILLLRRTNRGKAFLIWLGTSFPRFWKYVGTLGVIVGFLGSIFIFATFTQMTIDNILVPKETAGVAILLPSPTAETVVVPGVIGPPFWYWLISILLLALVHEGFHGIMSAREKVRIKSLGAGVLAVIPLAFVEPDEKQLQKKPVMSQLRVFAAGSWANFLLAGFMILLMAGMSMAFLVDSGVIFNSYPSAKISLSNVDFVNGKPPGMHGGLETMLNSYKDSEVVTLTIGENDYHIFAKALREDLEQGRDEIGVFQDYPAPKAGLVGAIQKIDGKEVKNTGGLTKILEEAGQNTQIRVEAFNGTDTNMYVMVTVAKPDPQFNPDSTTMSLLWLEQYIPNTVDTSRSLSSFWTKLTGGYSERDWTTIKLDMAMWEYAKDVYPGLERKAEKKIYFLEDELKSRNTPGFIGILGTTDYHQIKPGIESMEGVLGFLVGLFGWVFLINLFVGLFNLLPIKALDGGRMWDIVLARYLPKRRNLIMKILTYFTLFLIFASFAMVFGGMF